MPQSSPRDGAPKPKKLLDQVRDRIRLKNYSYRTEKSCVSWIKRFILFHDKRHPLEMDRPEIEAFLTHLVVDRNVAPSTQNQVQHAILFLYRDVLEQPITGRINALRAQERRRLPVVLSISEVESLLDHLSGVCHLAALLLYGSGLRIRGHADVKTTQIYTHVLNRGPHGVQSLLHR